MKRAIVFIFALTVATFASSKWAAAQCDLSDLVGYTLVAQKTIAGYIENENRGEDFEGCNFDRIIVFDDNTGVQCLTYSYSYSYRPEAYIFVEGPTSMKMCVEGELYDVAPLR